MDSDPLDTDEVNVLFMPSGLRGQVPVGTTVLQAAQRLGVPENALLRRGGMEDLGRRIQKRQETRSMEEKALALLLAPGAEVPPIEELPPVAAFFNPELRIMNSAACLL